MKYDRLNFSTFYFRPKLHKKVTPGKRTTQERDMEFKRRIRTIGKLCKKSRTIRRGNNVFL